MSKGGVVDYANAGFEDPSWAAAEDHYWKMDNMLRHLPLDFAMRWCEPGPMGCACLGCANGAGGLAAKGFTKGDWEAWKKRRFG